jgi:hypothetical protein
VGIDPKDIRKALMKGNGNLIGGKDHTEMIRSTYQDKFKGMRPRFSSKAMGWDLS